MYYLVCEKCGYRWLPRVPKPVRCPRCGSVYYDGEREKKK